MRKLLCAFFAALVLPALAHADTIRYFELTETFGTGRIIDFGTIGIDTTVGTFDSFNINYRAHLFPPYLQLLYIDEDSFKGFFALVTRDYVPFSLYLPVTSLVDYSGGPICSVANPCENLASFDPHKIESYYGYNFEGGTVDGSLTPISSTPEPSTLLLLATGTLALVKAARRRVHPVSAPTLRHL